MFEGILGSDGFSLRGEIYVRFRATFCFWRGVCWYRWLFFIFPTWPACVWFCGDTGLPWPLPWQLFQNTSSLICVFFCVATQFGLEFFVYMIIYKYIYIYICACVFSVFKRSRDDTTAVLCCFKGSKLHVFWRFQIATLLQPQDFSNGRFLVLVVFGTFLVYIDEKNKFPFPEISASRIGGGIILPWRHFWNKQYFTYPEQFVFCVASVYWNLCGCVCVFLRHFKYVCVNVLSFNKSCVIDLFFFFFTVQGPTWPAIATWGGVAEQREKKYIYVKRAHSPEKVLFLRLFRGENHGYIFILLSVQVTNM